MSRTAERAKALLKDLGHFSRHVLGFPLHDYQLAPLEMVRESVLRQHGNEFLMVFPRQSGKNEAVAHLLVNLLNLLQRRGGNIVYGATGDGLGRGIERLEERLDNPWNAGKVRKGTRPVRRMLGKAAVVFLSTHPSAAARGETAHWLLVIDELQEQPAGHLEAVFEPMRAAYNATALYMGTVKSTADALWQKKGELEELQRGDGVQRVYVVGPEQVTAENPAYGRFLEAKVARLGRRHPIVASEYFNEPLAGAGRLFDERRLALMRGSHSRRRSAISGQPSAGSGQSSAKPTSVGPHPITRSPAHPFTVATLDVAGQDEAATDPLARLQNPGRDYTVAHAFELEMRKEEAGPIYRAVDLFVDQGSRHFQDVPGRPRLAERLLAWLGDWGVSHLVADESGVGAGLVDWLSARLGADKVTGFTFSPAAKAGLGSAFLSVVETGRFRYWTDETEPLSDGWWFFAQAAGCSYSLPAEGRFERDLRWGVPPEARIDTPAGLLPLHDDRLVSAALVAIYDDLIRKDRLRLGSAKSVVIPPRDPLSNCEF